MDVTEIFQDFCNNVLRPIIKDAVNEALPKQEITAEEKRYYTVIQAAKLAHVSIATIIIIVSVGNKRRLARMAS